MMMITIIMAIIVNEASLLYSVKLTIIWSVNRLISHGLFVSVHGRRGKKREQVDERSDSERTQKEPPLEISY